LKDIARETGFSVNTVSHALRNMPDISPQTRELIQAHSHKIGYLKNALASSLRLGRTKTLAVIIPDVSNPFFAFTMEEIERGAREKGYSTFLLNTFESGEYELTAIKTALKKNVDGIIFSPAQSSLDNVKILIKSGTPFVLYARYFEDVETDYVVGDDEMGGYQATAYLIENGHRNILLLNGFSAHNSAAKERKNGYIRALREFGLPIQEDLICEISAKGNDCAECLTSIIEKRRDISAIFAYSDLMAWSAMTCLSKHNLVVPDDISIVGFDHIQAHLMIPFPITTIDNHLMPMSKEALRVLLQKINDSAYVDSACKTVLPTELYIGNTVKKLN